MRKSAILGATLAALAGAGSMPAVAASNVAKAIAGYQALRMSITQRDLLRGAFGNPIQYGYRKPGRRSVAQDKRDARKARNVRRAKGRR